MKSYRDIQGFFDYGHLFKRFIQEIPDGGIFVECGSWLGKSSAFLCDAIEESGKDLNLWIIDSWLGSSVERGSSHALVTRKDIYQIFLENMRGRKFNHIRGLSHEVCNSFQHGSCDVVFIDMEHTYESVKEDIKDWLPKVKKGGTLAGHDYGSKRWKDGVQKAVHETLGKENIEVVSCGTNSCWVYKNDK
jgi:predicted O-methyltransferase YrrM